MSREPIMADRIFALVWTASGPCNTAIRSKGSGIPATGRSVRKSVGED